MLTALTVHSGFDITIKTVGDLFVDGHHTVEDSGIVFGHAFKSAIGDMIGINRSCSSFMTMDPAWGLVFFVFCHSLVPSFSEGVLLCFHLLQKMYVRCLVYILLTSGGQSE